MDKKVVSQSYCSCGNTTTKKRKRCRSCFLLRNHIVSEGKRKCLTCNQAKEYASFGFITCRNSYSSRCKSCTNKYALTIASKNKHRRHELIIKGRFKKYNFDPDIGWVIYTTTASCQICNVGLDRKNKVIDHCHATGVFRGIICSNCNKALGQFRDDISLLHRAIDYLRKTYTMLHFTEIELCPDRVKKLTTKMRHHKLPYKYFGLIKNAASALCCEICNRGNIPLWIDHCHNSLEFRGMLCRNCNPGLGSFRDCCETINKAILYLNKN